MKKQYIEEAISGITAQLKRPMSNLERALLVADRKDFREALAKGEFDAPTPKESHAETE